LWGIGDFAVSKDPEILEQYAATVKLRKLGFTDEHLDAIRFSRKYRERPFDEWPITWHPSAPVENNPTIISDMKNFAAYRFALIDGYTEGGHGVGEAWSHVTEIACACRKSNPNILVVQPAQDRAAKNGSG
jgi:hypothetical protein